MDFLKNLVDKFVFYQVRRTILVLNPEEQIKYIADMLQYYYHFDASLSEEFYCFILVKIKNNDFSFLEKENIFQVIDNYRGVSLYVDGLDYIITPKQYLDTPIRYVQSIKKLLIDKLHSCPRSNLDTLYSDELIYKLSRQTNYLEEEGIFLTYKLLLSIGFRYALELLQGKYGCVSYATLYFLFYPIEVHKNVSLDDSLLNFLFGGEKRNSVMYALLNGKSKELYLNFSFFYHNFSYYYHVLNGNLSKRRVEELLEDRFVCSNLVYPDIHRDIVYDMISSYANRYGCQFSKQEIENIHYRYYEENMNSLIVSSIPQIHLEHDDLQVDVLAKSDPKILVMGYRANNCFRINGDASILFSKTIKSKDFRVVSVSSHKDNDIAMMLVARNGNVLIGQGIEISKSYQDDISRKKIYMACEEFLKTLMNEMNQMGDEIVLSVLGGSNRNVLDFNSQVLPFRVSPVFSGDPFLNFYNGFQFPQCLVAFKLGSNKQDIKLFHPTSLYYDKRDEVIYKSAQDYSILRNVVEKRVMSVSYLTDTYKERLWMQSHHEEKGIYCNKDWYLIEFLDGEVFGAYLENDFRAKEEYKFYLKKVQNNVCRTRKN